MIHAVNWPFRWPSWWSPVLAVVILPLLPILTLMQDWAWAVPVGLKVRLMRPGAPTEVSPGIQPLLIHVGKMKPSGAPTVTVNGQAVALEDLPMLLRRALWLRPPSYPVYLEGDPDMEWGNAVRVMDVIQGQHVPVILLTPKSR
jgi:hypothetical protein